jgi:hypothetical protein
MRGLASEFQGSMRRLRSALFAAAVAMAVPIPGAAAGSGPWVRGAAVSQVDPHTRLLAIDANSLGATRVDGQVTFQHRSPDGLSWFAGSVTCSRRSPDGVVLISGSIRQGRTAAGVDLRGKDFGLTVDTAGDPQRFSLPRFADAGALAPCSGGRPETVPVTFGGFSTEVPGAPGPGVS